MFAALMGVVDWVSVGHDHDNDFYGIYQSVNLAYGRKIGFGGYSDSSLMKGARVFEIQENPYRVKTWIREGDGNIDLQL